MYKNILLTLSFLIIFISPIKAQFNYGLIGGLNLNYATWKNVPDNSDFETNSSLGFHLGVFGSLQITEKLSIMPEVQYIQKGYRDKNFGIVYNYFELPLLLSYSFIDNISLKVGTGVSYRFSVHVDGQISDFYKKNNLDVGINFGLSYDINDKLILNGRYYLGFIPADNFYYIENADVNVDPIIIDQYNKNVSLSLAYRFLKNSL